MFLKIILLCFVEESTSILTKWAEKMIEKSKDEIRGWSVSGVSDTVYQVHDFKSGGIVDLSQQTCSCKYWDLTGLPCGHVIMVLSFLRMENCGHLALDAYKIDNYRNTYLESVYPLPEARDWEVPHDFMVVNPPLMDKRQAGRPRNTNRIPSQGEDPIRRKCSRCGSTTHTARNCPAIVPTRQPTQRRRSRASGSGTQRRQQTQPQQETEQREQTQNWEDTQNDYYCYSFDLNN